MSTILTPVLIKQPSSPGPVINADTNLRFTGAREHPHIAFVARAQRAPATSLEPSRGAPAIAFCHALQLDTLTCATAPMAVDVRGGWHTRAAIQFVGLPFRSIVAEHPIAIGPIAANLPQAAKTPGYTGGSYGLTLEAKGHLTFSGIVDGTSPHGPCNNKPGGGEENVFDPIFAFLTAATFAPLAAENTNATPSFDPHKKPAQLYLQSALTIKSPVEAKAEMDKLFLWYATGQWTHVGICYSALGFSVPLVVSPGNLKDVDSGNLVMTADSAGNPRLRRAVDGSGAMRTSNAGTAG